MLDCGILLLRVLFVGFVQVQGVWGSVAIYNSLKLDMVWFDMCIEY
jgi:hypothetical protein